MAGELGLSREASTTARRVDPKIPAGQVVGPGSGRRRDRCGSQRSVRVWLSAGPRASAVPSLTGETEQSAAAAADAGRA